MTIQRIQRGNTARRTVFEAHAESAAERVPWVRREGAGMTTRRGSDFEAMVRDELVMSARAAAPKVACAAPCRQAPHQGRGAECSAADQ